MCVGALLIAAKAHGQSAVTEEVHRPGATQLRISEPADMGVAFSFAQAQTSLVRILVHQDKISRAGTGFLVSGRRLVATSHHVVENGKNFHLGFLDKNGRARWIQAEIRASAPAKDLAILEAGEDIEGTQLTLAGYEPEWASDVYAIGYPVAADEGMIGSAPFAIGGASFLRPSVVKGIVSRVLDQPTIMARMQHQAPISPGYSGGPLLNRCGAVVGVSNSHHKTDNGLSYAILGSDLADFVSSNGIPASVSKNCPSTLTAGVFEPPALAAVAESPRRPQTASDALPASATAAIPMTDPYELRMFQRATECIGRGDISSARLFLQHLAGRGSARGMLGLGLTYDPNFLDQLDVMGLQPDVELARTWYGKALEKGAGEARWRLEALPPH